MTRRRVVILGGGHAGVRCARELLEQRRSPDELDVTLVSRENVEVWHGLMPQIVSGVLQAQHVLIPLREILQGATIYSREIESIDPVARRAVLTIGGESDEVTLEADYLVIALGSVTDLSRFPGLSEHALQTKTIGDFIHLRNHLIEMLEAASVTTDAAERQRRLTFVIVGAGYAGVEIASEANEFLRASLRAYPMIAATELRVITVDILTRVLPTFNDRLAQRVVDRMRTRGIEVRLGVGVKEATAGVIVLADGSRIETRSIIATGGIGTALAPIYLAHEAGRAVHVYVDETRPVLQGSRLTAWEMVKEGVPHRLISDVAAGLASNCWTSDSNTCTAASALCVR